MNDRPSGTVTFLFTDVEGSVRLWEEDRTLATRLITDHNRILSRAIETHGGVVLSTAGDSFDAAFRTPVDAVTAALEAQLALAGSVPVRMAIHAGPVTERDGQYFGPALYRCGRLRDAAHGGQVICSQAVADLIADDLGEATLIDLGQHALRDLGRPEHIYQLGHPDLASEFPPLKTHRRLSGEPGRFRPRRLTAAALGGVAIVLIAVSVLPRGGSDDDGADGAEFAPSATEAETTTEATVGRSDVLWSTDVGAVSAGPLMLGDMVVVSDGERVSAYDLLTGDPRWTTGGFTGVHSIDTNGTHVFVTSRERLDVLHPTTGIPEPGCGFRLPLSLATTAVGPDAVFILSGAVHRVATSPGETPCHGEVVENANTIGGMMPMAGPVIAGGSVVIADAVGVYALDADTLELRWRYPDRQQPAIPVQAPTLDAREYAERTRMTASAELIVAGADDGAILFLLRATDGEPELVPTGAIRVDPTRQVAIDRHAVVAVSPAGALVGIDPATGERLWSSDDLDVTAGPLGSDGLVAIAADDGLALLDPVDGSVRTSPAWTIAASRLAVGDGTAVGVSSDGIAAALAYQPGSRPSPLDVPAARDLPDPEAVAREFVDVWNLGGRAEVERLLGVDVRFMVTGLRDIWPHDARRMLWTWFEGDRLLRSAWELGDCASIREAPLQFEVTCSSTFGNSLTRAWGDPPREFATQITVYNGVVTKVIGGGNISRPGEGGVFTDLGGRWIIEDRFLDWAATSYPSLFTEACERHDSLGPECAAFKVAHADEWAKTLP